MWEHEGTDDHRLSTESEGLLRQYLGRRLLGEERVESLNFVSVDREMDWRHAVDEAVKDKRDVVHHVVSQLQEPTLRLVVINVCSSWNDPVAYVPDYGCSGHVLLKWLAEVSDFRVVDLDKLPRASLTNMIEIPCSLRLDSISGLAVNSETPAL